MKYLSLYNNIKVPQLGFGCAAINQFGDNSEIVTETIATAIQTGYRHLDTASVYNTEENVGQAIAESGIPREEFFVVTKLSTTDMEYDKALKAAEISLKKLQMDYINLYLIHWPIRDKYLDAWKALEQLYEEGMVKAIGGSNFSQKHFEGIAIKRNIKPMSNQIELNPYMQQEEMREFCAQENVVLTAWSPLGTGNWSTAKPEDKPLSSPAILSLSEKYHKTPAQIILRWFMDIGISVIPKSENPHRIKENLDIFDISLTEEDKKAISKENKNLSLSSEFNEANKRLYTMI